MNKWIMVIFVPSVLVAEVRSKEEYYALANGADACTTLRVVDDEGATVTNATVMGNFHMHDGV